MMDHLETEARNPASARLDQLSSLEFVRLMNREDEQAIAAVTSQAEKIATGIERIAERLRGGGRLIYAGAGTSGRLGILDATECPPTFNSPPGQVVGIIAGGPQALTQAVEGAEDRPELAERDLATLGLSAADILVGIATSGRTPYVLAAVQHASQQGAFTIGISCNSHSDLSNAVNLAITPIVGPEVLSGSTRLKAGTATKLVLNMLSTGAMVQLGKTFGNLMVDLRATNNKLRARTNRIVRTLTNLSYKDADELLARCDGELKTALVVKLAGVTPHEARALLHGAGGRVGRALAPSVTRQTGSAYAADLVLGLDGGGSRTTALLARIRPEPKSEVSAWEVLGRGEAGPSNLQAVGAEKSIGALQQAILEAFRTAQLNRVQVGAVCLGLAGAGRPEDQEYYLSWARGMNLAREIHITTDVDLLLAAGTTANWGVALVAGTGSIAFGRTADGNSARAGGWGYLLGDEGSGYTLAVAALQAVVRAVDGRGPVTVLTDRILEAWDLHNPRELVHAVYRSGRDRSAIAALAPLVLQSAESGDPTAAGLVRDAAGQLAQMAASVVRQLDLQAVRFPLALAGGLLLGNSPYRALVIEALKEQSLQPDPVTIVAEPAQGALRLAAVLLSRQ